jgi:hypothetical protein
MPPVATVGYVTLDGHTELRDCDSCTTRTSDDSGVLCFCLTKRRTPLLNASLQVEHSVLFHQMELVRMLPHMVFTEPPPSVGELHSSTHDGDYGGPMCLIIDSPECSCSHMGSSSQESWDVDSRGSLCDSTKVLFCLLFVEYEV